MEVAFPPWLDPSEHATAAIPKAINIFDTAVAPYLGFMGTLDLPR